MIFQRNMLTWTILCHAVRARHCVCRTAFPAAGSPLRLSNFNPGNRPEIFGGATTLSVSERLPPRWRYTLVNLAAVGSNNSQQSPHYRHQGLITCLSRLLVRSRRMCATVSYAARMLCLWTVALTATHLLCTAWLIPAKAQSPDRVYRLGHLAQSEEAHRLSREFTLPELAQLGFAEGRNLHFSARFVVTNALPNLAQELLAEKPDAIIAIGSAATLAVRAATDSVPIVLFAFDPVRLGVADSFSRPAGNVTGISNMVFELQVKRL